MNLEVEMFDTKKAATEKIAKATETKIYEDLELECPELKQFVSEFWGFCP